MIEDGVFWFINEKGNPEEIFSGLEASFIENLEASYGRYCLSIKSHQSCLSCNQDIDLVSLDEGKSISGWKGAPLRLDYGKKIKTISRYRNLITGAKSSASRQFNLSVENFKRKISDLYKKFRNKNINIEKFRSESSALFLHIYEEAWNLGRKSSGIHSLQSRVKPPSREEEKWFRDAVREELSFWNSFLDELKKSKGDFFSRKFSVEERLEMYSQTVYFMYSAGQNSGLPANVLLHWFPTRKRSGVMCPGCQYMVDHSPYPRDIMPTTPRAGDTPCLMRCVHKVVVRYVNPGDVNKRANQLPSKQRLITDLRRIMGGKIKKYRKRTKDYNPWLGSSTWGSLK